MEILSEKVLTEYLRQKISRALKIRDTLLECLKACTICPRRCKVNRLKNEKGFCRTGRYAIVSSAFPHFGEEGPLVGRYGSGTIFFSRCNLRCIYCQNYTISHFGEGEEIKKDEIARLMLKLQREGCHNINLVSPTHVIPQIIEALVVALEMGLNIPIVYNSGGYDSVDTLKLLCGIIEIYMPDTKYSCSDKSGKFSDAPDYWEVNQKALVEMHRQVGDLRLDSQGIAQKGLIIRHLVLPGRIDGAFEVLKFIATRLSKNSYINIMDQYHPCFKAHTVSELNRAITLKEYREVVDYAKALGLFLFL